MSDNIERLKKDVEFLTNLDPPRNYRNLSSLEDAANYIASHFQKAGAKTRDQYWTAGEKEYRNVIASYNSSKSKRLIVGAHYDVYGDLPGADDNASAVAGLLELARMVFENKPQLDYRIDFVAYCLEEPPFFGTDWMGSYIHAKSLHEEKAEVVGMICLEMIGYFSDEPESQPFPSPDLAEKYPHTANFIIVVGVEQYESFNNKVHRLMANDAGIDVQVISFPSGAGLAGLSDHRSYWKFNYPALMINDTSFIRNPYYHTKEDTIDKLDFKKMAEVVNSTYSAITNML